MNQSFEFREVTHFTAGAIGDPGERVFYLQVGDATSVVAVKLEKQQVKALAQFLKGVLDDLPSPTETAQPVELQQPALSEWTVGQIAVGIDEAASQIIVVIEELVELDDADELDNDLDLSTDFLNDGEEVGARIRAHVDVESAANFIATSDALMNRGRPPCRLCGQPLDRDGHNCPRLN